MEEKIGIGGIMTIPTSHNLASFSLSFLKNRLATLTVLVSIE